MQESVTVENFNIVENCNADKNQSCFIFIIRLHVMLCTVLLSQFCPSVSVSQHHYR